MLSLPIWKTILRQNFTSWEKLADFLNLSIEQREVILKNPRFKLNLPLRLAEKMAKKTLADPLLKQFLPTQSEKQISSLFVIDPVQDGSFRKESKLLHKYEGRVLLVCTSACAMHCRYCFRQNFDYEIEKKGFKKEIEVIKQDASIREVILSGGDPLSLSNETLGQLLHDIAQIPHIRRIRFHTRFPIGIPERIDEDFLAILKNSPCRIWFVIHANHAREMDKEIFAALYEVQKLGIPVLCQTVLLKGVNDRPDTLKNLFEALIDQGIMPYYLHQLDRVQGAEHFEVSEDEGRTLIKEVARQLPGYAIPSYVKEIPGFANKTPI